MITFKNVSYKVKNKEILKNISFDIKDGEIVLLLGESGSGKSTIFNLIMHNIYPSSGSIYYDKKDISKFTNASLNEYRRTKTIMISQVDDLFENQTVLDNLLNYYYYNDCINILKKANLLHLKNRFVYSLSGGERQRVFIVKSCLANCQTILCDEITSALDYDNAIKIISFIKEIFNGKTIIFISHQLELFENNVNRIICIQNKSILKNQVVNEFINKKERKKIKRQKSLIKISLLNGFKKFKFLSFVLFSLMTISLMISLKFNSIFSYFSRKSYTNYYDYNVLYIKNNHDLKFNDNDILYSYDELFKKSNVKINNKNFKNIIFYPSTNCHILTINTLLLSLLNINELESIKIANEYFSYETKLINIINENNMFSVPCIYYDVFYFKELINDYQSDELVIINYDFEKLDERFAKNSIYEIKDITKPYLESKAYSDYLTYEIIFQSIEQIVDSISKFIFFYAIIITILFNITLLMKDKKKIAILISRGNSTLQILISYVMPLIFYIIPFIFISLVYKELILIVLLTFTLQLLTIIIAFYYIKKQSLFKLLKEENY